MKTLNKTLNDYKTICFVDFEGTQNTQEIFAIGAVKVDIDNKCQIIKTYNSFKVLVKTMGNIGSFVENLTGIKEQDLKDNGISFIEALNKFEKYLGNKDTKIKFMTYGNFDIYMLTQTAILNSLESDDFVKRFTKNYIDFSAILSNYIRSNKNEKLSLIDSLKIFKVTPQGNHHDPESDAINLMLLYQAFLKNKNIVKEEYIKTLKCFSHAPGPIQKSINKLFSSNVVTFEEFESFVEEELK